VVSSSKVTQKAFLYYSSKSFPFFFVHTVYKESKANLPLKPNYVVRENKRGGSPSNCRELFPGRKKERGSNCENKRKQRKTNGSQEQNKT
jgi:hypothetical protein